MKNWVLLYKIELIADKDQNNTYVFENLWIHKYYFGLCHQSILFYIITLNFLLNVFIIFSWKLFGIRLYNYHNKEAAIQNSNAYHKVELPAIKSTLRLIPVI